MSTLLNLTKNASIDLLPLLSVIAVVVFLITINHKINAPESM